MLTSNNYRLLPEPLLSRCPPIRLQALSRSDLVAFVRREGEKRGLSDDMVEAIAEALNGAPADCAQLNLRTASRLLQRAEELENAPVFGGRHSRPIPAIRSERRCGSAPSPKRPIVHRAAFFVVKDCFAGPSGHSPHEHEKRSVQQQGDGAAAHIGD
ncbi:hypothetical protein [uncultured Celeribacter sp.]|uniref:hypothetical protein n=1 Tax=uncultured Celeribacter sp. TaxID=1303376 RepID=UPI002AA8D7DF|nr:hypothetical protein [uncultured Celeribacter sp.]